MRQARVWLVLLLFLLTLTTACGAQATQGQVPEVTLDALGTAASFVSQINLPRIVVEYDDAGVPSFVLLPGMPGIKTTAIQPFVPWVNLRVLHMRTDYVDWFTRSNLQHIEIEHNSGGLFLYANGKSLPHIAWDDQSLKNAGEVARMLNVRNAAVIERLLPFVQKLGIDVVLKFPVAEGNEPIAYRERGATRAAAATEAGEPSAVIHLAAEYGEDGVPRVLGFTTQELYRLTGVNLGFAELPENTVAALKAANVQHVQLQTRPDRLRILVNGMTLPALAYSEEELNNAVDLYQQLFPAQKELGEALRQLLMMVQQADVDLAVQFPVPAGAERIPLQMGN